MSEKIRRFKVRDGVTEQELRDYGFMDGGTWITKDAKLFNMKRFNFWVPNRNGKPKKSNVAYYIEIAFSDDIQAWDDFKNVLIMDDDFGQPYTPFYEYYGMEVEDFLTLEKVIRQYNYYMSTLPFLEEIKEV